MLESRTFDKAGRNDTMMSFRHGRLTRCAARRVGVHVLQLLPIRFTPQKNLRCICDLR